jgi:NADPH:quinone reductase-like Zn-dependent oxidoreductase
MATNRTAFIDAKDALIRVADSEIPAPGADDIIVRNHAVAINTNDPARQAGFLVKTWPTVPGHVSLADAWYVSENIADGS